MESKCCCFSALRSGRWGSSQSAIPLTQMLSWLTFAVQRDLEKMSKNALQSHFIPNGFMVLGLYYVTIWLVLWNMNFIFYFIYGMSSETHWRSPSFFRGVGQPPTSYVILRDFKGIYMGTSASKFPSANHGESFWCLHWIVLVGVNSYPVMSK